MRWATLGSCSCGLCIVSLIIDSYDGVGGCGCGCDGWDRVESLVALSISLRAGVHGGDGNRDANQGSLILVCPQQLNPSDGCGTCGFESDAHTDTTRESEWVRMTKTMREGREGKEVKHYEMQRWRRERVMRKEGAMEGRNVEDEEDNEDARGGWGEDEVKDKEDEDEEGCAL